ncbi:MAG: DUF2283 domain-containing protein [Microbacterium gubbeenense]
MNSRKTPFEITVDGDADAAYITMTDRPIAESRELGGGVIVDLDDVGIVVGIEILGLETKIPFDRLTKEFHVHTGDVDYLKLLQPSIQSFVLQHSVDGSSRAGRTQGSLNANLVSM